MPIGVWRRMSDPERRATYEKHVLICALQYLAGVRKLVVPGMMLDGYEGPLFESALTRQCRACGMAPGSMCIDIDAPQIRDLASEDLAMSVVVVRRAEPHEIRMYV